MTEKEQSKSTEKNIDTVKESARELAVKKVNEFLDSLKQGIAAIYDKVDKSIQLTPTEKKTLHEFNQSGLSNRIKMKLVDVKTSKIMMENKLEKTETEILQMKNTLEKTTDEIKKETIKARIELRNNEYKQLLVYIELLGKMEEKLKDALQDLKIRVEVEPLLPVDEEVTKLLEEAQEAKTTSDELSGLAEKEEAKSQALKETGLHSLEEE